MNDLTRCVSVQCHIHLKYSKNERNESLEGDYDTYFIWTKFREKVSINIDDVRRQTCVDILMYFYSNGYLFVIRFVMMKYCLFLHIIIDGIRLLKILLCIWLK